MKLLKVVFKTGEILYVKVSILSHMYISNDEFVAKTLDGDEFHGEFKTLEEVDHIIPFKTLV